MKSGIKQVLNPNLRSNDAKEFETSLRRRIVGQDAAVEKVTEIYQMFLAGLNAPGRPVGNLLFLGPTGSGKCLGRGTPVLMFDGSVKKVEEIIVGDYLMGPDSKPRKVLSLAHGWDEMYNVTPVKGDSYRVNQAHILSLTMTPTRHYNARRTKHPRNRIGNSVVNLSVKDYLTKSKTFKHRAKGYRVGVEFEAQALPLDPYFFGLWLGDGTSAGTGITSDDIEIIETIYVQAAAVGMEVAMDGSESEGPTTYRISTGHRGKKINKPKNPILEALRDLGVLNNKHIPLIYKANNRENRLQLLAGLIDSDGTKSGANGLDYVSKEKVLADGVAFIARSLGLAAYVSPCYKICQTGGGGTYYRVSISGHTNIIPIRLPRKHSAARRQKKSVLRTGIHVTPTGYGEYFGFEINGDRLFLLGDFTVTHNTRMVEATAESLFNDSRACIKIDCAEFQHSHEIAKLVGSPPGYLGHRETHPLLTQEALNQWFTERHKLSILLFDEIEKASDSLWQLLLGILDKATLTLGDNRRVDFSQCIIIMTSNLGAVDMLALQEGKSLGFQGKAPVIDEKYDTRIQETAVNAARRKFTPEFMNRIDKTVVFKTLRDQDLAEILNIELGMVQRRILTAAPANQFMFTCSDRAKAQFLKEGTDSRYGARHLKRAIEKNLVFPLANLVATSQIKLGDFIVVDHKEGEWTFVKEGEGTVVPASLLDGGARLTRKAVGTPGNPASGDTIVF